MGDETWRVDDRPKCERCDEVEAKARRHLSELTAQLNVTAGRWAAVERAARVLEDGLDAQDLPKERRVALLELRIALARED